MLSTVVIHLYVLEIIYGTAFLIACLAMALLGRLTTRGLLLFIAIVAVLFVCCKTAREIYDNIHRQYTTVSTAEIVSP